MKRCVRARLLWNFLVTYGWVIIIIFVVVVALSHFGVFDFGKLAPRRCVLEAGIGCMDFNIQEDSVTLVLKNSKGDDITISSISVGSCSGSGSGALGNGEQAQFIVYGCNNVGITKFDGEVNITYTGESGLEHTTIGKIMGEVSEGIAGDGGEEGDGDGGEDDGLDLPSGPQRYFFRSNPASPQMLEATIDPLDVHPGDTQTMTVIARDKVDTIISVTAAIETDNSVRDYEHPPLSQVTVSLSVELVPLITIVP